MKIVMLRPSYTPEISGGNHLARNLIDDLIKEGFDVELIVPLSAKMNDHKEFQKEDYPVHRIRSIFTGKNKLSRVFRYIDTSFKMFLKLMSINDIDLIYTHSMPPTIGPLSVLAGKLRRKPVVYWEQDIVSESILTTGITNSKILEKIFYRLSKTLENISAKGSSHIITISEKFKEYHMNRGIPINKVDVIYNWIDTSKVTPISRTNNELFEKYDLDPSKFIVSYCGNLGVPQNVEVMIDAAEMLQEYSEIQFVIIGGGSREDAIKLYIKNKKLRNLKLFPLEPMERTSEVYSLGDVGLVIAKEGTSKNGFPSKTWSILSAGQAIISVFDLDSELSNFVKDSQAGISIKPDSPKDLKEAIVQLYNSDISIYKKNARDYVTKNFSRRISTGKIIAVIEKVIDQK